ncbi:hypothetical protein PG999_007599 [Apiospora kogelbergensis]|uniref:Uncharacterized protein n=1 Tax=Apiospora kogelbergensis TaxID=1337665 RepID=A0AAW0QLF8_9PEZI
MFSDQYRAVPTGEDGVGHARGSRFSIPKNMFLALPFVILQAIEIALLFSLVKRPGCPTDTAHKPGSYHSLLEFSHSVDIEMIFHKEDLDARVHNFTYWRSLFPTAQGLVSVPRDSPLAPPGVITVPSALDGTHSVYQVSMFHTLHCLETLRLALDGTARDQGITEDLSQTHAPHCIDWIRQEVMCSADIALNSVLDEYRTPHQCRDFDRIMQWTETHGYRGPVKEILHHKLDDTGEVVPP